MSRSFEHEFVTRRSEVGIVQAPSEEGKGPARYFIPARGNEAARDEKII
jgi:hypothetical protein